MPTKKTVKRKVTIDFSDTPLGIQEFEAEVVMNLFDLDGSRLIVLKTDARESVQKFLSSELTGK